MSPTATGGPSTRTMVVNGGRPTIAAFPATNGMKIDGLDVMRGVDRVYPHLDDLVNVRPDVDIHAPIRQILQKGESFAKQADTHLDFRRPEVALQEYVKALIVATDIVPQHKDWPSLQGDRGELHRLFTGLKKRINAQHEKFDGVKELIKENNDRSGVKPTLQNGSSQAPGDSHGKTHVRSHSVQPNGTSAVNLNGFRNVADTDVISRSSTPSASFANVPVPRKKPPVQPKPDALLGKAIHTLGNKPVNSPQIDLAARFARLRGSESSVPVQDPRIRTHPISIPEDSGILSSAKTDRSEDISQSPKPFNRPSGPREMPSVPSTSPRSAKIKLPLDVNIPTMPKAPDAIYSPARGSDTAATINLPSSTPRGSYIRSSSRQNSVSSISKIARSPLSAADEGREHLSGAHTVESNSFAPLKRTSQDINFPADKIDITPGELVNSLKTLRCLLVDIRTREEYDSGHIMTQHIICVEPITIRPNMSAEELEESIILAPDAEQDLFKQRHEFDLIVYYNQSSCQATSYGPTGTAYKSVLEDFSKAIYEYGYEKKSKRRPILLFGGLDAWVDVMGPGSLQSSQTGISSAKSSTPKPARPLGRVPMARDVRKLAEGRRKAYESRLLSAEEESKWDQVLQEDNQPPTLDTDAYYVRTTEDFFRRFPEVSVQESMVTPTPDDRVSHQLDDAHQRELASTMPPPPARPAPALPRQSFSGVSEKAAGGSTLTTQMSSPSQIPSISSHVVEPGLTGLYNFDAATCYMNSVIQCLSATPPLRKFLINYHYPDRRPPRKADETTDPPQLMVRNVGNLFRYLWNGQYVHITPRTFRDYVFRLHGNKGKRSQALTFGGRAQQDATEFLEFILEVLSDELNPFRNRTVPEVTKAEELAKNQQHPVIVASSEWQRHCSFEGSIITQNLQGLHMSSIVCRRCHKTSRNIQPFTFLTIPILEPGQTTLTDLLGNYYKAEEIQDFTCEQCNQKGAAVKRNQLCRLPPYLILTLSRFTFHRSAGKLRTRIDFPKKRGDCLDMSPYFIPLSPNDPEIPNLDPGIRGPFRYDCYGFIKHQGESPNSGHYIAETSHERENGKRTWYDFNDTRVKPSQNEDMDSTWGDPYILFYKRHGL